MRTIHEIMEESGAAIAVAGHVNPDGDCVGSCVGLFLYLKKNYPEKQITLFLEQPKDALMSIKGAENLHTEIPENYNADLLFLCDVSTEDRIGAAGSLLHTAAHSVCIDHHVSNPGFADENEIRPDASSCAEVLCGLLEKERMDADIAAALYTGIVHDSGVFAYSCTSPATMRAVADLMEFQIPFQHIIEDSFYSRTEVQNRVLGFALEKMELSENKKVVFSSLSIMEQIRYHAKLSDLDAIVSQLRLTKDAEAAVFLYETKPGVWKASLRSCDYLDVAAVASEFGGGGHVRAAGCTLEGRYDLVRARIMSAVLMALRKAEA
ncbi:MAG: bifunctional oligoribonuclease/PAP phosphatase NrnA [Lachnospiraceae bacterium]|nr:bifunctional oligoribonuclease/PAP phosphatase NrnA [Lachnospiraceae bacterium]